MNKIFYLMNLLIINTTCLKNITDILLKIRCNNNMYSGYDDNNRYYYFISKYINKTFSSIDQNNTILFYQMSFNPNRNLGNTLGHYFQAISCAKYANIDFIGNCNNNQFIKPYDCNTLSNTCGEITNTDDEAFINKFPIYINSSKNNNYSIYLIKKCLNGGVYGNFWGQWSPLFPWETYDPQAGWYANREEISRIFIDAINNYVSVKFENIYNATITINTFDIIQPIQNNNLSFIPDVLIIFRCNDILSHNSHKYGLLNFNIYTTIIPDNTTRIYINTELKSYGHNYNYCNSILYELVKYLSNNYPSTIVAIRRGYPIESLVQIMYSPIVISCPSTFSFWPAISKKIGKIYYSSSKLILTGRALPIQPNFNWIISPQPQVFGRLDLKENIDDKLLNNIIHTLKKDTQVNIIEYKTNL